MTTDSVFLVSLVIFGAIIFGALGVRVLLHFWDTQRIRDAASRKGWTDIEVSWSPFAPGWFFEQSERHYQVVYRNAEGARHTVYCKTSLMTGVYWRDGA